MKEKDYDANSLSALYSVEAMHERQRLRQAGQLNAPLSRCSREQWMRRLSAMVAEGRQPKPPPFFPIE